MCGMRAREASYLICKPAAVRWARAAKALRTFLAAARSWPEGRPVRSTSVGRAALGESAPVRVRPGWSRVARARAVRTPRACAYDWRLWRCDVLRCLATRAPSTACRGGTRRSARPRVARVPLRTALMPGLVRVLLRALVQAYCRVRPCNSVSPGGCLPRAQLPRSRLPRSRLSVSWAALPPPSPVHLNERFSHTALAPVSASVSAATHQLHNCSDRACLPSTEAHARQPQQHAVEITSCASTALHEPEVPRNKALHGSLFPADEKQVHSCTRVGYPHDIASQRASASSTGTSYACMLALPSHSRRPRARRQHHEQYWNRAATCQS